MVIKRRSFGRTRDGQIVEQYALTQENGSFCILINYGAAVQRLVVPDCEGKFQDIVLGFDTMDGYESELNPYMGATVGRHANRIVGASFELNGKTYRLAANDRTNHLHGGLRGFDKVIWTADIPDNGKPLIKFHYLSPDGEEGYPGNLDVCVTYELRPDNSLWIDYEAVSDATTVINLTNHSYFNLRGQGSGSILGHEVNIEADQVAAIDDTGSPYGPMIDLTGSALDFRDWHTVGERIDAPEEQMRLGRGYDHPYVLRGPYGTLRRVAQVYEPRSGRLMTVETTSPGMQFYTANMLRPVEGKEGVRYDRRDGFCMETQFHPNSLAIPSYPQPVFKAGEPFKHTTVYRFSIR